jgi:hypothetical protein
MGNVLVIYFSNSGCTKYVLEALLSPIIAADHRVRWCALSPQQAYPFPWTHPQFYETYPEALAGDLPCLEPMDLGEARDIDLVILGWQVWFLRPSPPVQAFLRSRDAEVLCGKRVVSVVSCRQMWRTAYGHLLQAVTEKGGYVTDNVIVTHRGGARTLVTTPRTLIRSRREHGGVVPSSLLDPEAMALQNRLGELLCDSAADWPKLNRGPLLSGVETASTGSAFDLAEWIGNGYMIAWGGIARLVGGRRTWSRSISAFVFAVVLTILVPFVVLVGFLVSTAARLCLSRLKGAFAAADPGPRSKPQ